MRLVQISGCRLELLRRHPNWMPASWQRSYGGCLPWGGHREHQRLRRRVQPLLRMPARTAREVAGSGTTVRATPTRPRHQADPVLHGQGERPSHRSRCRGPAAHLSAGAQDAAGSAGAPGAFHGQGVVSNDSDLSEPLRLVRHEPGKEIGLLNPHKTPSKRPADLASSSRSVEASS
jgi:hypothetical protein